MAGRPPAQTAPSAHKTSTLRAGIERVAEKVRSVGADAEAKAKAHPLETVTGAFGLGYLIGKALFGRKR